MTADGESPPIIVAPKPRRKRRLLRFALWFTGGLVVLWIAAFLHATWSLNNAIAALKARGEPTTFEEALARDDIKVPAKSGAEFIRQAFHEDSRVGNPGLAAYRGLPSELNERTIQFVSTRVEEDLRKGESIVRLIEAATALPPGRLIASDAKLPWNSNDDIFHGRFTTIPMLLSADARFSAAAGNSKRSFERLKTLYLLSEQFSAEKPLLPQRMRLHYLGIANRAARQILSITDFDGSELAALANVVERLDRELVIAPALINERALKASLFDASPVLAEELHVSAPQRLFPGHIDSKFWNSMDSWWIELVCSPVGLPARRRAAAQTLNVPNEVLSLADTPPPWPPAAKRSFDEWSQMLIVDRISLHPSLEADFTSATYIAHRIHRQLAMVEMAFRLRRFELLHGKLPDRLDELIEPKFPELPTKWFEGKPFVYSKKGRAFTLEANPEVKAEVELPDDNHRDAWGMLLQIDEPKSSSKGR